MKACDLIAELQKLNGDTEVWFTSCCYPSTKWFQLVPDPGDGSVELEGYEGSFVAGDPDESPFPAAVGCRGEPTVVTHGEAIDPIEGYKAVESSVEGTPE